MLLKDDGADLRADVLAGLHILDTPSEQAFDDIVYIAAQTCDAPIALISLLDGDRQWFKARLGLDASETPITQSVCSIEIDRAELLEIADLTRDDRTCDNPLVTGERAFRFYAGAPLVLRSGAVVGRLCVIDFTTRPEGLSDPQRELLRALARQVSDQLELRRMAQNSETMLALQAALVEIADLVRNSKTVEEMTRTAAAIVGQVMNVDRAGFGTVDENTHFVDIEPDWTAPGVTSIAGRHRFEDFGEIRSELTRGEALIIHDVLTDPRTASDPKAMTSVGIGALVNMPVRNHQATVAVFIVQTRRARIWTENELTFLRSVADRLEAGVSRLRLVEQQHTVNGEISHRLKNMLTMVQAIATQTLRHVPDRGPVQTFERRLVALSNAHDVLMQKTWTAADIGDIARSSVTGLGLGDAVTITGPDVALGSRAALSFALLMHELLTNAVKHGALSVTEGRVSIDWAVADIDDVPTLTVQWKETGGPPVEAPLSKGFGSRLIALGLLGTGGVDVRYRPAGLEVDLQAVVGQLSQS
jgi:two-component sensor histidine kinase